VVLDLRHRRNVRRRNTPSWSRRKMNATKQSWLCRARARDNLKDLLSSRCHKADEEVSPRRHRNSPRRTTCPRTTVRRAMEKEYGAAFTSARSMTAPSGIGYSIAPGQGVTPVQMQMSISMPGPASAAASSPHIHAAAAAVVGTPSASRRDAHARHHRLLSHPWVSSRHHRQLRPH